MIKKKSGSFLKQAAILAAAGILVRFLGFLYRIPLTNMIGNEGNGIYSAGYYIYTFLLILSSAGLPAAISRMVSERIAVGEYRNAHQVFRISLMLSASMGFVFMVLLFVFAEQIATVLAHSPSSYYCILTLSPTIFIVAIMSVYRGYFQGMNTMVPTAVSQIMEQVFNAFFSVYLAYVFLGVGTGSVGGKNISLGAAGGTAGTGIGALVGLIVILISYYMARPRLKRQIALDTESKMENKKTVVKKICSIAVPIIAGTAVFSITNLIDMNMVMRILQKTGFSEMRATELYGMLSGKYVTLTTLPVAISTAIATAAIPSIAKSVKLKEKKMVKRKMNVTLRVSMIISIPAAVGIGVLGDKIILMLFPRYPDGGMLLMVGSVSIIFLALCQTVTGILQGIGCVRVPVVGAILGAIVKVVLNILLISNPKINVLGAVISTTGCYLVASVFNLMMLSYITKVKPDLKGFLVKPLIGSIIMGVVCIGGYYGIHFVVPNNTIATLGSVCVGIGAYGVVMLLVKGIKEEDLEMLPLGRKMINTCKKFRLL